LTRFGDSARHWYRIFDEVRTIQPLEEQPQYKKSEITHIADNILLFQKNNGGWAKNYDVQAILTEEQVRAVVASKDAQNTTFDNGATHSHLTYLAEVYTLTGREKYKQAFLKGMDFTLQAQYDNGGWPQRYPDTSGYHKHITFNDNAMVGILAMFQKIVQHSPEYDFIGDSLRQRISKAYEKGIDCILKCQIVENGKKTAWCQQHDHIDLSPQDARSFEKASICNGESADIVKLLMQENNPSPEIIEAIEGALQWFQASEIYGIKMQWKASTDAQFIYHRTNQDRIVVKDSDAPRIWARFYELGTHRPIFCGRDGVVKYDMSEIDRDRRTGYAWYTYAPEEVYAQYADWQKKWTTGRNILK